MYYVCIVSYQSSEIVMNRILSDSFSGNKLYDTNELEKFAM